MGTLISIESFVRSVELGSFSAAGRLLGITPGGVSKNVAKLEADLGTRLLHRSTRSLTLTEAGEQFLVQVTSGLDTIQSAIANVTSGSEQPAGSLKVALGVAFGRDHILPLLGEFLALYPSIKPSLHFDNRQVSLISEGFDVAIGGGVELTPGIVVRELAKVHLVLVASPDYLARNFVPKVPSDLSMLQILLRYSQTTNRVTPWHLRTVAGDYVTLELTGRATLSDPEALCHAAIAGLGVAHVPMPHAIRHLESGVLVRVLPDWYTDHGAISLYFAAKKLLPKKTRVFVDFIVEKFRSQQLSDRWSATR
jgi:DNA-binding transcriptional LysR family regulator